ncbi:MAG: undecaprenyl-diphosphate phosphatase [Planctomycetes bacterium]|nr:undecaprenyl-diphosphate phosphatase [Planctomycetota bacterium]
MVWWHALLLGVVQGLTEFLPVSSTGHLVLGKSLLGARSIEGASFEVSVHMGTLGSVLLYYRRDLAAMARETFSRLFSPGGWAAGAREEGPFRLLVLVLLATVPAGAVGLIWKDEVESMLDSPRVALYGLLATGLWLLATRLAPREGRAPGLASALAIGLAQAVAILPGISRSGSTVGAGLFCRLDPQDAARFSFLMSIPVILGAAVLKAPDLVARPPAGADAAALVLGTVAAFAFGLLAIRVLLVLLARGRLACFGVYCLLAGGLGLLFL